MQKPTKRLTLLPLDDQRLLVPPPDAAGMLSISERSLWGRTAPRGPIPCVRIGSSVRYSPELLRDYLRTQANQEVTDGQAAARALVPEATFADQKDQATEGSDGTQIRTRDEGRDE